tara:strand:- start:614 stop:970 length:357 start_codon:yes stop_codon:yes gene_type:complete
MLKLFRNHPKLNWSYIESDEDLQKALSSSGKIALFKHSIRCPISSMAKSRLEKSWDKETNGTTIYFLDLIQYRELSNKVASQLAVDHASPQLILIEGGMAIYNASHNMIQSSEAAKYI